MNIVLIGYRCTGKTSVGRVLATRLGMAFYDTDTLIQEENDRTVEQIVASDGWYRFREEEKKIITRLALQDNCVIALGGGAVLDPENVAAMRISGRLVWLIADLKTIQERMTRDSATGTQRPPLRGQSSSQETTLILEERTPIYEAAADIAIDTRAKTVDELASEVEGYFI